MLPSKLRILLFMLVFAVQNFTVQSACITCDNQIFNSFIHCLSDRIFQNNYLRETSEDELTDMKNSIIAAVDAMHSHDEKFKDRVLIGVVAGEMTGLLTSVGSTTDPNTMADELTSSVTRCYADIIGEGGDEFINGFDVLVRPMLGLPQRARKSSRRSQSYAFAQSQSNNGDGNSKNFPDQQRGIQRSSSTAYSGAAATSGQKNNQNEVGYRNRMLPAQNINNGDQNGSQQRFQASNIGAQESSRHNQMLTNSREPPKNTDYDATSANAFNNNSPNYFNMPGNYQSNNGAIATASAGSVNNEYLQQNIPYQKQMQPTNFAQANAGSTSYNYPEYGYPLQQQDNTYPSAQPMSKSDTFSATGENIEPNSMYNEGFKTPPSMPQYAPEQYAHNSQQSQANDYPDSNTNNDNNSSEAKTESDSASMTEQSNRNQVKQKKRNKLKIKNAVTTAPINSETTTAYSSSKQSNDSKQRAMTFGEHLFVALSKNELFCKTFNKDTSIKYAKKKSYKIVLNGLKKCGYSSISRGVARLCKNAVSSQKPGSSSQAYSETISKTMMQYFYDQELIENDSSSQAKTIAAAIIERLSKNRSSKDSQQNESATAAQAYSSTSQNEDKQNNDEENEQLSSQNEEGTNRNQQSQYDEGRNYEPTNQNREESSSGENYRSNQYNFGSNEDSNQEKSQTSTNEYESNQGFDQYSDESNDQDAKQLYFALNQYFLSSNYFSSAFNENTSTKKARYLTIYSLINAIGETYEQTIARETALEGKRKISGLSEPSSSADYSDLIGQSIATVFQKNNLIWKNRWNEQATDLGSKIDYWISHRNPSSQTEQSQKASQSYNSQNREQPIEDSNPPQNVNTYKKKSNEDSETKTQATNMNENHNRNNYPQETFKTTKQPQSNEKISSRKRQRDKYFSTTTVKPITRTEKRVNQPKNRDKKSKPENDAFFRQQSDQQRSENNDINNPYGERNYFNRVPQNTERKASNQVSTTQADYTLSDDECDEDETDENDDDKTDQNNDECDDDETDENDDGCDEDETDENDDEEDETDENDDDEEDETDKNDDEEEDETDENGENDQNNDDHSMHLNEFYNRNNKQNHGSSYAENYKDQNNSDKYKRNNRDQIDSKDYNDSENENNHKSMNDRYNNKNTNFDYQNSNYDDDKYTSNRENDSNASKNNFNNQKYSNDESSSGAQSESIQNTKDQRSKSNNAKTYSTSVQPDGKERINYESAATDTTNQEHFDYDSFVKKLSVMISDMDKSHMEWSDAEKMLNVLTETLVTIAQVLAKNSNDQTTQDNNDSSSATSYSYSSASNENSKSNDGSEPNEYSYSSASDENSKSNDGSESNAYSSSGSQMNSDGENQAQSSSFSDRNSNNYASSHAYSSNSNDQSQDRYSYQPDQQMFPKKQDPFRPQENQNSAVFNRGMYTMPARAIATSSANSPEQLNSQYSLSNSFRNQNNNPPAMPFDQNMRKSYFQIYN